MKKLIGKITVISFLLLCSLSARISEPRPYRLINADELTINQVNNEYVSRLRGNVHFFYGDTEFRSREAFIYETQRIARLFGNVEVVEDTLRLYANKVEYFRNEEQLHLEGNVVIEEYVDQEKIRSFRSHRAEYSQNPQEIYAYDNIKYIDYTENVTATCHYLYYSFETENGFLLTNPVVTFTGQDSLTIKSERIDFYNDTQRVTASFNVETYSEQFKTNSNFLLFFLEEERAVYRGNPRFTSDFADGSSETMQVFFKDRKIDRVHLDKKSEFFFTTIEVKNSEKEAETLKNEKLNWVKSDFMEFFFEEGNLKKCIATKNVTSFFKEEDESKDMFINNTSGDKMIINMIENNEIESIVFKNSVEGIYRFQSKLFDN